MRPPPRLRAQALPLRRTDGSVQFGLDVESGIRLTGLSEAEVAWICGTQASTATGTATVLDEDRIATIVGLLQDAGLVISDRESRGCRRHHFTGLHLGREIGGVVGAEVSKVLPASKADAAGPGGEDAAYATVLARTKASVWLLGRGELAASVGDVLRQAGVGHVVRSPDAAGLLDAAPRRAPALVILTSAAPPGGALGRAWLARGIPLLPVTLGATCASVGPLVTGRGPCLRCLDLVRGELDPSWWWLRAQVSGVEEAVCPPATGEVALVTLAAGLTARVALAVVDGHPIEPGLALDLSTPWPVLTQRRWPRHPDCPCGAPRSLAAGTIGA